MPRMNAIILLALGCLVAACEEDEASAPADRVRAIKTYTVTEPAGSDLRRYSGTLVASDTSSLSFSLAGTVATVDAVEGQRVTAGETLATLDSMPFELDRDAALAELGRAEATSTEKQTELARQRTLFKKGWVAKAALDQAVSAAEGAEAQLNLARSRLGTAERNLRNATLTAPFDGLIASRDVEPFQEVASGQSLFQINSDGALEVIISVSDAVVNRLVPGATATVDVPTVAECGCTARIIEIGTASGTANTVTVKAALLDGPPSLLPGMSTEVTVALDGTGDDDGFLIPLTAIAAGDEAAPGYVFIFDPDARVVRKTPVRGGDSALDNLVSVVEGVSAGDVVAAAGVSFLRDGQTVKLLGE
ncbi:MAG: efflux RND transporter periplasmic adaptor subunit [Pseudomonadota bacterium]